MGFGNQWVARVSAEGVLGSAGLYCVAALFCLVTLVLRLFSYDSCLMTEAMQFCSLIFALLKSRGGLGSILLIFLISNLGKI